jgi:hypothetical protein
VQIYKKLGKMQIVLSWVIEAGCKTLKLYLKT